MNTTLNAAVSPARGEDVVAVLELIDTEGVRIVVRSVEDNCSHDDASELNVTQRNPIDGVSGQA